MTKISGIYAATLSILNSNLTLNVEKTIKHADNLIDQGCHGIVIFGSTGQSQLISLSEKISLVNELSKKKHKQKFIIGTGLNSLGENINYIKICLSLGFENFLLMPPAYYNYSDNEVILYFKKIVQSVPKVKIILYNFEKLCGYKFSVDCINELINKFPNNIVGVKDSSYNLYKNLNTKNFSVLPGSEVKLLDGLKAGCSGIISATCNVTASLSRKVYDDYFNNGSQTHNEKLSKIRKTFDQFNLISAVHSYWSQVDKIYENILPTLKLLENTEKNKLISDLKKLNFNLKSYGES